MAEKQVLQCLCDPLPGFLALSFENGLWFEPKSISRSSGVIIWLRVILKRSVRSGNLQPCTAVSTFFDLTNTMLNAHTISSVFRGITMLQQAYVA